MYNIAATKSESVVENARHAREERAQQRRRESAATVIQAVTRGYLSRRSIATRWRSELDSLIGWESYTQKISLSEVKCGGNVNDIKQHVTTSSAIDKISTQRSKEDWQFASFGSNTLTGAYSNLSNKINQEQVSNTDGTSAINIHHETKNIDLLTTSKKPLESSVTQNIHDNNSKNIHLKQGGRSTQIYKPEKVVASEIFQIVKKFLFIFDSKTDKLRFKELCKYLLHNTGCESSAKFSYIGLCTHKQLVRLWIPQIKKLLSLCCKYLDTIQIKDYNESQYIAVYLGMLLTFTDVSHWKAMKKQVVLRVVLTQICSSLSCDLYKHGCLSVIGSLLTKSLVSSLSNNSIIVCITMSIRVISAENFTDDSVVSFVLHILTVPSLVWQINEKTPKLIDMFNHSDLLTHIITLFHVEDACSKFGVTSSACDVSMTIINVLCVLANLVHLLVVESQVLERNRTQVVSLLNQLLKFLHINTTQHNASNTTWHPVLGYFAANEMEHAHTMQYVKKQLEFLWEPKFVRVIFHDVLTLPSLHDDTTMPAQAEQISTKTTNKPKLSDKFSSYLKKIASSRPKNSLLPTGGRKLEYTEVKNTCCACLLYRRALSVVTKQLQLEMLTGLTFMDEVLCRMWRFICELGPSGGLQLFLSALTLPTSFAEPYFAVFTLFCDMTAHILSILDDVEFYEQQIPFHLMELVTISAFLRQFVFKVIWGRIVTDSHSPMFSIFDSAHTLLMMLHDRDARRSFTPTNHWLCKDVKSSVIRSEVEKSHARARMVLEKIPFVIPHNDRVVLFRSFVETDKSSLGISGDSDTSVHIRVHRSRLVEDGFVQLSTISTPAMKGVIRVKFINDLGLDEAGIDQDGVFKEFLEEIIQKVFNPDMNLFKPKHKQLMSVLDISVKSLSQSLLIFIDNSYSDLTEMSTTESITSGGESKLYPSPLSHLQDDHFTLFSFVGRMLGKAVYEGIVLDIPFANFFLRNLLSRQHAMLYSPIDELPSLDAEFYKNLTWIKRYEGDISDLGLTFTYEEDIMGQVQSHELIPGGSAITVTNENRIMYIHTLAHYRMHTQIRKQTKAFVGGFRSIIAHAWTTMFSAPELQRLISGDNVDVDLTDLKRHVVYYGGFHSSHRVVRWLWDILERDYSPQGRAGFLKFVTSCSRPPLLGFAHLHPQFSIRCVEVPDDEDTGDTMATVLRGFFRLPSSKVRRSQQHPHRLPTASTCFNLLKLPNYPSKDVLREKLKQAIANNTGFELS